MNIEGIAVSALELIARGCKIGMSLEIMGEVTSLRIFPYDDTDVPEDDES